MYTIHEIFIVNGNKDGLFQHIYDKVKHAIPKDLQKKYEYSGDGPLSLPLFVDSEEYKFVFECAVKCNLKPDIYEKIVYTKQEENDIEYFDVWVPTPLQNNGARLVDYGTVFEGGCTNCGCGKNLIGSAYVDRKFVKKYDVASLGNSVFIMSRYIKSLVEDNQFDGIVFDERLLDYKNREMDEYYCAKITNTLPKMSEKTWIFEDRMRRMDDSCKHYPLHLRSAVKYSRNELKCIKDFNLSSEFFYYDRSQRMIVSKRVKDLLVKQKIRLGFQPIQLLD